KIHMPAIAGMRAVISLSPNQRTARWVAMCGSGGLASVTCAACTADAQSGMRAATSVITSSYQKGRAAAGPAAPIANTAVKPARRTYFQRSANPAARPERLSFIHCGVGRAHLRRLRLRVGDLDQRTFADARTVARGLQTLAAAFEQLGPEGKDAALHGLR